MNLADAAERVLAATSGQIQLVGFSLGAIVAFEVLRRAPQRISGLTLISANPRAPTPAQLDAWARQQQDVENGMFVQVAERLAEGAGPHRQVVLEMALRLGPQVFLEQLHLLRTRPDSRADLAKWHGPLTLLSGQADPVTPPTLAREMAELAPQADLQVISSAGHYLPLEAPQAVAAALGGKVYG